MGMVKFGRSEHIEQFAQGLLYMNTLEHFVKHEISLPRQDSREGTCYMRPGDGGKLNVQVDGEFRLVGGIVGTVFVKDRNSLSVNVFCMCALRDGLSGVYVDPANFEFGESFAMLKDFDEFMNRVEAAVPDTGQQLHSGYVQYVEEGHYEGRVGIFRKLSNFSYQSEFRLALRPGKGEVLLLNVGDISDIVICGRSSDLNDRLSVRVNKRGLRQLQIRN